MKTFRQKLTKLSFLKTLSTVLICSFLISSHLVKAQNISKPSSYSNETTDTDLMALRRRNVLHDMKNPSIGPGCGGGGGIVELNPQLFRTIDLFNLKQEVYTQSRETFLNEFKSFNTTFDFTKTQVLNKNILSYLPISRIIFEKILPKWIIFVGKDSKIIYSPELQFLVMSPFQTEYSWSVVNDQEFNSKMIEVSHYRSKNLPSDLKIITSIAFDFIQRSYFISFENWNKLDSFNQLALYLHELLRFTQMDLKANFDDEKLQKITSLLVSCEPNEERLEYFLQSLKVHPGVIHGNENKNNEDDLIFDKLTSDCSGIKLN